jgi:hypothetical protein
MQSIRASAIKKNDKELLLKRPLDEPEVSLAIGNVFLVIKKPYKKPVMLPKASDLKISKSAIYYIFFIPL